MKTKVFTRSMTRWVSVLSLMMALCMLSGCALTDFLFGEDETTVPVNSGTQSPVSSGTPISSDSPSEGTTKPESGTSVPTGTASGPDVTTAPKQETLYPDPLTGLYTEKNYATVRPVSVVIDNTSYAMPQSGISTADIVMEVPVEGGITRLMLITNKYVDNPVYGPVRSTRDYMVGLSQAFGTLMVGAGYSPTGFDAIQNNKLDYIDGTHDQFAHNSFFRDQSRYNQNGYEHSLMITGNGIRSIAQHNNFSLVRQGTGTVLKFASAPKDGSPASKPSVAEGAQPATRTILTYSNYQQVQLLYGAKEKAYYRYEFGTKAHYDAENGEQLRFENVFILFTAQNVIPGDEAGRLSVTTVGTGTGYYLTGGTYIPIQWSRSTFTSAFTFTTEAGGSFQVTPGKTFIAVMNSSLKGTGSVVLNQQ